MAGVTVLGTTAFEGTATFMNCSRGSNSASPSAFPLLRFFRHKVVGIAATWPDGSEGGMLARLDINDVVATSSLFHQGIMLMSLEYAVFCLIAAFGFLRWRISILQPRSAGWSLANSCHYTLAMWH